MKENPYTSPKTQSGHEQNPTGKKASRSNLDTSTPVRLAYRVLSMSLGILIAGSEIELLTAGIKEMSARTLVSVALAIASATLFFFIGIVGRLPRFLGR